MPSVKEVSVKIDMPQSCEVCGAFKCDLWNKPGEHGGCGWPGSCHGGHHETGDNVAK